MSVLFYLRSNRGGQEVHQGNSDISLPSDTFEGSQGVPRAEWGIDNLSSVTYVCPGFSSQSDVHNICSMGKKGEQLPIGGREIVLQAGFSTKTVINESKKV